MRAFQNPLSKQPPRGFSLVEMLVVIAIISVLLTVGAVGIRSLSGGKGTSAGLATVEAMIEEARASAIKEGKNTYLVFNGLAPQTGGRVDPKRKENYLRQMYIAYDNSDLQNGTDLSLVSLDSDGNRIGGGNSGILLPDNTFFNKELSELGPGSHKFSGVTRLSYPGTGTSAENTGPAIALGFNSRGVLILKDSEKFAKVVLSSGIIDPTGNTLRMEKSAPNDHEGMVVWKTGRTTLLREGTQVNPSPPSDSGAPQTFNVTP